ncbi:hypothetical protein BC941DRAFT_11466 [Chlamydoabsidia padenii]|nr:hypothetical protein BC941DRAFT_11466 [Chlamydoabsidia padenii]
MLEEWSSKSSDLFDPTIFKRDLASVRDRIGASIKGIKHSRPNKILKEGCVKLGVPVMDCPINNRDAFPRDRKVNTSTNFWRYRGGEDDIKQIRTANSWLRDAEAYGARFIDQAEITKISIQDGKASGVECLYKGITPLTYTSRIVVVASGSLRTPDILRRSGLKNKHLGRHLRLHPTVFVQGFYDEPQADDQQENEPLVTAISHVSDKTCSGHRGSWIQVPSLSPALASVIYPWRGALQHKQVMAKFRHAVPLAVMASDRHSVNSVRGDGIHSTLAKLDETTLINGLIRAFRILAVTGAKELHHSQLDIEPFRFDNDMVNGLEAVKDDKFNAWLDRVRQIGIPDTVLSMHQMGTCRMGKNAQKSVTKVTGETWEVDNLYVGDASLFMTSSGVDPMLTVETLAYGVARNIISRLGKNSW